MIPIQFLVIVLLCAGISTDVNGQDGSGDSGRPPVPPGASPELQAIIAEREWPDLSTQPAAPSTDEAWLQMIAEGDASRTFDIEEVAQSLGVDVVRDEIAGVPIHRITPESATRTDQDRLFLFVHGGAYVFMGGDAGTFEGIIIAARARIPVISVDYRMPPRHPFPAAVDDTVAVYRQLIESQAASAIAIGGTSAGGGLALATVHQLKNLDVPLPGAVYAGTPWADLTKTGDSMFTNELLDRILLKYEGLLAGAARLYAGDHDLKHPLISPVYGDFAGFPPTIFITGTRDMFLSDTVRTHRKMRAAGAIADLHVYEGMSHAGYLIPPTTPESADAYREIAAFLDRHLD